MNKTKWLIFCWGSSYQTYDNNFLLHFFFSQIAFGKCFFPNPLNFLLCSWIKYLLFPSSPQIFLFWTLFIWNFHFANTTLNLSASMFMEPTSLSLNMLAVEINRSRLGTSVLQIIIYHSDKMLILLDREYLTKKELYVDFQDWYFSKQKTREQNIYLNIHLCLSSCNVQCPLFHSYFCVWGNQ